MVDSIDVLGMTFLILDGSIDVPQATFHALADSIGVQCATFGILAVSFEATRRFKIARPMASG